MSFPDALCLENPPLLLILLLFVSHLVLSGLIVEHGLKVESRRLAHVLSSKSRLLHEVLGLDLLLWLLVLMKAWGLSLAIYVHLSRRYLMVPEPLLTHWVTTMSPKEGVRGARRLRIVTWRTWVRRIAVVSSRRALLGDLWTLTLSWITDLHRHNCGRYPVHGRCQRLLKWHIVDMLVTSPLVRRIRVVHAWILGHMWYLALIDMTISVWLKICSVATL